MRGDKLSSILHNVPWLIEQSRLHALIHIVDLWANGVVTDHGVAAREPEREGEENGPAGTRVHDGVAVMRLHGVFSPRLDAMTSAISGGVSAVNAALDVRELAAREDVHTLVLNIDSPGGQVEGVQELADAVYEAREQVRTVAVANFRAASAAYWVGAQAQEFIASPSSVVGSVGVAFSHRAVGRNLERQGIDETIVSIPAGKRAVNNLEPLSGEGMEQVKSMLTAVYEDFLSSVARGRGVALATVRDGYGQGAVLTAAQALEAGMVDSIGTLHGVVRDAQATAISRRLIVAENEQIVELQAKLAEAEKARIEAEAAAASMARQAMYNEKLALVREWQNLGVKADEMAEILTAVQASEPDVCTKLEGVFRQLNTQAKAGALFQENGRSPQIENVPSSASEELAARAQKLVAEGRFQDELAAKVHVQSQDRDLVQRIRDEHAARFRTA